MLRLAAVVVLAWYPREESVAASNPKSQISEIYSKHGDKSGRKWNTLLSAVGDASCVVLLQR